MNPQYFWQVAPKLATTFTLSALMACSYFNDNFHDNWDKPC
jgi:hypothetical protein